VTQDIGLSTLSHAGKDELILSLVDRLEACSGSLRLLR
jgi:hypothetical protein